GHQLGGVTNQNRAFFFISLERQLNSPFDVQPGDFLQNASPLIGGNHLSFFADGFFRHSTCRSGVGLRARPGGGSHGLWLCFFFDFPFGNRLFFDLPSDWFKGFVGFSSQLLLVFLHEHRNNFFFPNGRFSNRIPFSNRGGGL